MRKCKVVCTFAQWFMYIISWPDILCGGSEKTSGHSRIHFLNPAGMLAEPIKTLRAICDNTNTQDAQSYEICS